MMSIKALMSAMLISPTTKGKESDECDNDDYRNKTCYRKQDVLMLTFRLT